MLEQKPVVGVGDCNSLETKLMLIFFAQFTHLK